MSHAASFACSACSAQRALQPAISACRPAIPKDVPVTGTDGAFLRVRRDGDLHYMCVQEGHAAFRQTWSCGLVASTYRLPRTVPPTGTREAARASLVG